MEFGFGCWRRAVASASQRLTMAQWALRAEDRKGDRWRSSWATNGRASRAAAALAARAQGRYKTDPFVIRDVFFMSSDDTTLEDLRRRLNEIDRRLLAIVAERKEVSREVARVKRATGRATRDYEREREVILGVRAAAAGARACRRRSPRICCGYSSVPRSRRRSGRASPPAARASGRRVLVIGGAGLMGRWFVDFLSSQGFAVEVADPAGARIWPAHAWMTGARPICCRISSCSQPRLASTDAILRDLALRRPPGVIFDIGSLKSPLRAGLLALRSHGCKVASVHPMFGPDTELLSGRHVIFVDLGMRRGARGGAASCSRRRWPSRSS